MKKLVNPYHIYKSSKTNKLMSLSECTTLNPRPCELNTTMGLMMKIAKDSKVDTSPIEDILSQPSFSEDMVHSCLCSILDKLDADNRISGEIVMELGFPDRPCPGVTTSHAED